MKTLKLSIAFVALIGMVMTVSSCKKNDDTSPQPQVNLSLSADDALAESIFDNITIITDEAYDFCIGGFKSTDFDAGILGPCATKTLDTTVFPRELTIDFGEENCLCQDGKYRRGKILVTFTGRYRKPGTVITTGFEDYFVNDNQVDGTKVVTNMGRNEDNHPWFTVNVVGIIHKALNGGTLSWNAQKEREWIEGFLTPVRFDDVYLITGTAQGIRPNGNTWERTIINPLRKEISCKWIVSGTVEIIPEGLSTRLLDYGNGDCDNIATILIDGVTYTIFLP